MSGEEIIDVNEQRVSVFDPGSETYSSRVLRNLTKNPLFKPNRGKDGRPSEREMLTVSTTLLAAADERIASLEKKALVLNAPLFQAPMLPGSVADALDDKGEASWLMK